MKLISFRGCGLLSKQRYFVYSCPASMLENECVFVFRFYLLKIILRDVKSEIKSSESRPSLHITVIYQETDRKTRRDLGKENDELTYSLEV